MKHRSKVTLPKVAARTAISKPPILNPFFFEENGIAAVTINSEYYINTINGFMEPQLKKQQYGEYWTTRYESFDKSCPNFISKSSFFAIL